MTWPRYLELCEYWQRVPPLAETVAGFVGALGKEEPASAPAGSDEAFDALIKDFGFATS